MIAAPPWPRIGEPEHWTHLVVTLRGAAADLVTQTTRFELWSAYPGIVVQESVDGRETRDARANVGASAALDVERQLCLVKTGQDAEEAYKGALAIVVGPVAAIYDGDLSRGWRLETSDNGTTYSNDGPGPLREATLDPGTGLPIEANTVDGRWLWSIVELGADPPPDAPDVTQWAKESHERIEVPTEGLIDAPSVEHIHFRSSTHRGHIDFVATGGDNPIHAVIERDPEGREAHFALPDGRAVTIVAGDRAVAEPLVRQVHERLQREGFLADVDEGAERWDERMNALVGSIARQSADHVG